MSNFQVRGCCCGIPFGCGVLLLALGVAFLWKLAMPGDPWLPEAGKWLALLAVPGIAFVLATGARARRR
jgi:hypothetical protein